MSPKQEQFSIISTQGRQFKVSPGMLIDIDYLEQEPGSTVAFTQVCLTYQDNIVQYSAPAITGTVVKHFQGPKVQIIKFRRRKHHLKRMGFRPWFTRVQIS